MPNTPVRRLENCCMPPKKSAWRFENTKLVEHSSSELQCIESDKTNNHVMGIMSDDKAVGRVHLYPPVETFSRAKHEQSEDAPIDFSFKKCDDTQIKTQSINHLIKQVENYDLKRGNMIIHPQAQTFYSPNMLNGSNSPPSPPNNNSPKLLDSSHASSSCKDSDSVDMDCSQESTKSPHLPYSSSTDRMNHIIQVNSPEHQGKSTSRTPSRENSPLGQSSLLEDMLRGQQKPNFGIPNRPQIVGPGYGAGLGVYDNQIITSPSPPMAVSTPVMHPASMLPLTMAQYAQYLGYNCVEPNHPFMQGYMYKPLESTIIDVRKPKRKIEPFSDSLKSYTIEDLQKKLESLGGDARVMNSDCTVNSNQTCMSQGNGRRFVNNASPIKSAVNNGVHSCSTVTKRENCETDNVNQNQIVGSTVINHNHENSAVNSDVKPNENGKNAENINQINGANNTSTVSCTDDTNDSQPCAIPESSSDGRKRRSIPDYKEDPNYRAKRAKNNMAARKSRESRRLKEELIRRTAAVLEQQYKIAMRDITALKLSHDDIQLKYFNLLKEFEGLKIQNSVLVERLNQKRCGQCGSPLPNVN